MTSFDPTLAILDTATPLVHCWWPQSLLESWLALRHVPAQDCFDMATVVCTSILEPISLKQMHIYNHLYSVIQFMHASGWSALLSWLMHALWTCHMSSSLMRFFDAPCEHTRARSISIVFLGKAHGLIECCTRHTEALRGFRCHKCRNVAQSTQPYPACQDPKKRAAEDWPSPLQRLLESAHRDLWTLQDRVRSIGMWMQRDDSIIEPYPTMSIRCIQIQWNSHLQCW